MAFTTEEKKIIDILGSGDKLIFKNIDLLIQNYKDKTGKKVNAGCPSCVRVVILTLKNIYKMVNFKFKRNAASYKNEKGDKTTISNSTMTDEKALKFLKTNPERIKLFSEFPSNWKKLIKGEIETEEEKENRIAIEAEKIEAAKQKAANSGKSSEGGSGEDMIETDEQKAEGENKEVYDALKPLKDDLLKMSLTDLRAKYPEVKATSISAFVDKVFAV